MEPMLTLEQATAGAPRLWGSTLVRRYRGALDCRRQEPDVSTTAAVAAAAVLTGCAEAQRPQVSVSSRLSGGWKATPWVRAGSWPRRLSPRLSTMSPLAVPTPVGPFGRRADGGVLGGVSDLVVVRGGHGGELAVRVPAFFLYVFGTVFSLPCGARARPRSTYSMAGPTCSADQRYRAAARRVRELTTSRHTYGS
jgi:hypothetical protein